MMERKEKIKRITSNIAFTAGIILLAKVEPICAVAFLAYLYCWLWDKVEDIQNVIVDSLPKFADNITGNIEKAFENVKKELPEKIYKGLKKRYEKEKKNFVWGLSQVEIRDGGVIDRQSAIEVIDEFKKHGVELYHTDSADKINKLDDYNLIEAALNLIELKLQADNSGGE